LQASVTKTLAIKGEVRMFDMTDEVEFVDNHAVAFGAFSDVWKGKWWDRVEKKERLVAVKFLRQVMVQGVKEKLLKVCVTRPRPYCRLTFSLPATTR
jgi:ribosomal 30S subunit maturation factor RimM